MSTFTRSLWGYPCHALNKYHGAATFFKSFISGLIYASTFSTVACLRIKSQNIQSNLDKTACTALVMWGIDIRSSIGSGKLTKVERDMIKLAPLQHSVIIGLLLSDGLLTFSSKKKNHNPRLGFKHSLYKSSYVYYVFNLLSHYCSSYPVLTKGVRSGNTFLGLQFFTRAINCFNELHSLFNFAGKKVIPHNIYELLTSVTLSHILMGEGVPRNHPPYGIIICIDSYSTSDVVRFISVLIIRYKLDCILRFHMPTNHTRIYVRECSMPILRTIIRPHMHSSITYKIKPSGSKVHYKTGGSKDFHLDPWFITGFIDAEGSFGIQVEKCLWKAQNRLKLSNSGEALKLLVPNRVCGGGGLIHLVR